MQQKLDLFSLQTIFDTLKGSLTKNPAYHDTESETILASLLTTIPDKEIPDIFSHIVSYLQSSDIELVRMVKGAIGVALLNEELHRISERLAEVVRDRKEILCLNDEDLSNLQEEEWGILIEVLKNTPHVTILELQACKLDKFSQGWKYLNDVIKSLPHLMEVDLSRNPIGHFPGPTLMRFSILLATLPDNILLSLRNTDLGHLGKQLRQFFSSLRNLRVKSLDLSQNELYRLHQNLGDFLTRLWDSTTDLESLNLSENGLWNLPTEIWQDLPEVFAKAPMDVALNLAGNKLGKCDGIPFKALSCMPSKSLILDQNELFLLSADGCSGLGHLLSCGEFLESLSLKSNSLTAIASTQKDFLKALSNGKQLKKLCLSDRSCGTDFDKSIREMKALEELDLSNNSLGDADPTIWNRFGVAFKELTRLRVLDLSNTKVGNSRSSTWQAICNALGQATKIEKLILSNTEFGISPLNLFPKLNSLTSLDLSNNSLHALKTESFAMLYELPAQFPKLAELNLSKTGLLSLMNEQDENVSSFLRKFYTLKKLYLHREDTNALPLAAKQRFHELVLIHPSLEEITFLPLGKKDTSIYNQQLSSWVSLRTEIRRLTCEPVKPDALSEWFDQVINLLRLFNEVTDQLFFTAESTDVCKKLCGALKKDLWTTLEAQLEEDKAIQYLLSVSDDHPFFSHSRLRAFMYAMKNNLQKGDTKAQAFYHALSYLNHRQSLIRFAAPQQSMFDYHLIEAVCVEPSEAKHEVEQLPSIGRFRLLQYLWLYNVKLDCDAKKSDLSTLDWFNSSERKVAGRINELRNFSLDDINNATEQLSTVLNRVGPLWRLIPTILPITDENKGHRVLWDIIDKYAAIASSEAEALQTSVTAKSLSH